MASRVTFRFKSATAADTVVFEGMCISVGELKRAIVEKKGLSRDQAMELELSEAQTGRGGRSGQAARDFRPDGLLSEWEDDAELIQKNTSVVVRRVPGLKTKTLTATEARLPGCEAVNPGRGQADEMSAPHASANLPSAPAEAVDRVVAARPAYGQRCSESRVLSRPAADAAAASLRDRTGPILRRRTCRRRPAPRCSGKGCAPGSCPALLCSRA